MQIRPFSQSVCETDDGSIWTISTLTREAYENIILPISHLTGAEIHHKNDYITFDSFTHQSISYAALFEKYYIHRVPARKIRFDMISPTAFKSAGRYLNMPSAKLVFAGLARRYDSTCEIHDTIYDTLLEEIEQRIQISRYQLRSAAFHLEGVRIPSFLGSISFHISGNPTFASFINMLTEYAVYAGVGIKTALGMGMVTTTIAPPEAVNTQGRK